ncbi:Methyltransferase-like protein 21D [Chytridiales sp. JEL 0842]|nr:Methyltransferase-like protein 21D [Chytridiales sp. JEL 0842]
MVDLLLNYRRRPKDSVVIGGCKCTVGGYESLLLLVDMVSTYIHKGPISRSDIARVCQSLVPVAWFFSNPTTKLGAELLRKKSLDDLNIYFLETLQKEILTLSAIKSTDLIRVLMSSGASTNCTNVATSASQKASHCVDTFKDEVNNKKKLSFFKLILKKHPRGLAVDRNNSFWDYHTGELSSSFTASSFLRACSVSVVPLLNYQPTVYVRVKKGGHVEDKWHELAFTKFSDLAEKVRAAKSDDTKHHTATIVDVKVCVKTSDVSREWVFRMERPMVIAASDHLLQHSKLSFAQMITIQCLDADFSEFNVHLPITVGKKEEVKKLAWKERREVFHYVKEPMVSREAAVQPPPPQPRSVDLREGEEALKRRRRSLPMEMFSPLATKWDTILRMHNRSWRFTWTKADLKEDDPNFLKRVKLNGKARLGVRLFFKDVHPLRKADRRELAELLVKLEDGETRLVVLQFKRQGANMAKDGGVVGMEVDGEEGVEAEVKEQEDEGGGGVIKGAEGGVGAEGAVMEGGLAGMGEVGADADLMEEGEEELRQKVDQYRTRIQQLQTSLANDPDFRRFCNAITVRMSTISVELRKRTSRLLSSFKLCASPEFDMVGAARRKKGPKMGLPGMTNTAGLTLAHARGRKMMERQIAHNNMLDANRDDPHRLVYKSEECSTMMCPMCKHITKVGASKTFTCSYRHCRFTAPRDEKGGLVILADFCGSAMYNSRLPKTPSRTRQRKSASTHSSSSSGPRPPPGPPPPPDPSTNQGKRKTRSPPPPSVTPKQKRNQQLQSSLDISETVAGLTIEQHGPETPLGRPHGRGRFPWKKIKGRKGLSEGDKKCSTKHLLLGTRTRGDTDVDASDADVDAATPPPPSKMMMMMMSEIRKTNTIKADVNMNCNKRKRPETPPKSPISLWDHLPSDIHHYILTRFSDPLTQHLNYTLTPTQTLFLSNKIWAAAFDMDWDGDLSLLPEWGIPDIWNGLGNVRSRGMYERLLKLGRETIQRWEGFVKTEKSDPLLNEYFLLPKSYPLRLWNHRRFRFLHIPMRNSWWDLLDLESGVVTMGRYAIQFGHEKLLELLMKGGGGGAGWGGFNPGLFALDFWPQTPDPFAVVFEDEVDDVEGGERGVDGSYFGDGCGTTGGPQDEDGERERRSEVERGGGEEEEEEEEEQGSDDGDFDNNDDDDDGGGWGDSEEDGDEDEEIVYHTIESLSTLVKDPMSMILPWTEQPMEDGGMQDGEAAPSLPAHGSAAADALTVQHTGQNGSLHNVDASNAPHPHEPNSTNLSTPPRLNRPKLTHTAHPPITGHAHAWNDVITESALSASLSCVHLLNHRHVVSSSLSMDLAASKGLLDIVVYLHRNRWNGCTTDAIDLASANGHLHVVEFLHEHTKEGCTTAALDSAAENGHLPIVRFLTTHRTEGGSPDLLLKAVRGGHLPIVQHLITHYPPCIPLEISRTHSIRLFESSHPPLPCPVDARDLVPHSNHVDFETLQVLRGSGYPTYCSPDLQKRVYAALGPIRLMDLAGFWGDVEMLEYLGSVDGLFLEAGEEATMTSEVPYHYRFNNGLSLSVLQNTNPTTKGHGSTVWDSALIAAKYIEKHSSTLFKSSRLLKDHTSQQSTGKPVHKNLAALKPPAAPRPSDSGGGYVSDVSVGVAATQKVNDSDRPLKIIELGSGTGLLGLIVSTILQQRAPTDAKSDEGRVHRHRVVLTDLEDVMPLLQRNVEHWRKRMDKFADMKVSEDGQYEDYDSDEDEDSDAQAVLKEHTKDEASSRQHEKDQVFTASNDKETDKENDDAKESQEVSKFANLSFSNMNEPSSLHVQVTCKPLPWSSTPSHIKQHFEPPYDYILVSDCMYDPSTFVDLVKTMDSLSGPGTRIVVAYERRVFDREIDFFRRLGERFQFRDVKPDQMDSQFQADDVYLFTGEWTGGAKKK